MYHGLYSVGVLHNTQVYMSILELTEKKRMSYRDDIPTRILLLITALSLNLVFAKNDEHMHKKWGNIASTPGSTLRK